MKLNCGYLILALVFLGLMDCPTAVSQTQAPGFTVQELEFFETKVRPILVERCYECHGPDSKPIEGGLSMASRKAMLVGGDTGPLFVPGKPEESLLVDVINYGEVYEMPPDTKMPEDEIKILTEWVSMKAPWPAESDVQVAAKETFDLKARKDSHWCWQPIRKPTIPKVSDQDWPQDAIDHFVLEKIEAAKLKPASRAAKETLIRRAYFDLIGMPPTPAQIDTFVADDSENAFETVIDELLASQHYGERWARHWMDLSRYAESGGHEFDYTIPHAHQYRDYLIRAFNSDVSYKQFIHEHLAGDLLKEPRRHPTDDYNESILGTGFWFLGEAKHAPVDSRLEEAMTIDNQIDVMSKSFLGLTVACARCHDHKFDAISAEDYYALAGFLQSSRRQDAMLDPGRRIENAHKKASALFLEGSRLASQLANKLKEEPNKEFAKYLGTAIGHLKSDRTWLTGAGVTLQAEAFSIQNKPSGVIEVQTIKPQGKFQWQGDQQQWWRDGKVGESLEIGFELPKNFKPGTYEVFGNFTKARDYGQAKIFVNGSVAKEKLDFYDAELGTTGEILLGEFELKRDTNRIKFELLSPNSKAIDRNMVGLDFLRLNLSGRTSDFDSRLANAAKENSLEVETLKQFVAALQDASIRRPGHFLYPLFKAIENDAPIDSNFVNSLKMQSKRNAAIESEWMKQSEPFASFKNGIPDGWFSTGFAFNEPKPTTSHAMSTQIGFIQPSGVVSSGQVGKRFFGVLRSPTFELAHSHIHYKIRGEGVTVRLIINGYSMDSYNALLFKGCRMGIKPTRHFTWQTQGQDIGNHRGQRAHIEIIDHGDGWCEVEEIRFSNGARPQNSAESLANLIGEVANQEEFANSVTQSIAAKLTQGDNGYSAVANWILEHSLFDEAKENIDVPADQFVSSASPTFSEMYDGFVEVKEKLGQLNEQTPRPFFAIGMTDGTPENEFVFIRGNPKTLGKEAKRRFLSAISSRSLDTDDGSGRLLLANKITARNNPLTTRVIVNRIWHHLLGRGIVETVDDFGKLGKAPTHPELLDYLAVEFSRNDWSIKQMIKRIMLTQTYQMESTSNPDAKSVDPDNLLLHRGRIRRLQGEAIRDSLLSISGRLDPAMYGPPVPIHLTPFMSGRGRPGRSGPIDGNGRRSIYISVRRNFLSPMMLTFDTPIPFNTIGKRNQSNVPAQALIMMNDPFVIGQAREWAAKLCAQKEQATEARVKLIYRTALGRIPTEKELSQATAFIQAQGEALGVQPDQLSTNVDVWADYCHVIFNLKEFIYIN